MSVSSNRIIVSLIATLLTSSSWAALPDDSPPRGVSDEVAVNFARVPEGHTQATPPGVEVTVRACPTLGLSSYAFFTVSHDVNINGFHDLFNAFMLICPSGVLPFTIAFGAGGADKLVQKPSANLQEELRVLMKNEKQMNKFYKGSLLSNESVHSNDVYNETGVDNMMETLRTLIGSSSRDPDYAMYKKQFLLITDYIDKNIINELNDMNISNVDIFAMYYPHNSAQHLRSLAKFPVFSMEDVLFNPGGIRKNMSRNIDFEIPRTYFGNQPSLSPTIFMLGRPLAEAMLPFIHSFVEGPLCAQPPELQVAGGFVRIFHRNSADCKSSIAINEIRLPWLGSHTRQFAENCITSLSFSDSADENGCPTDFGIYTMFVEELERAANDTIPDYSALISSLPTDVLVKLMAINIPEPTKTDTVYVISNSSEADLFENLIMPLQKTGFLSAKSDNQVLMMNSSLLSYDEDVITLCRDHVPRANLSPAHKYKEEKHFEVAITDLIWISTLAAATATATGIVLYVMARRRLQAANGAPVHERSVHIALKPKTRQPEAESMPWKIDGTRVRLDTSVLLGGGLHANVFLGHLVGRAPLMEWSPNSPFYDCDVAIRVTREHGEEEEDELSREMACMQRLRGHQNLSMFLGWTHIGGAICSLLELTPTTLVRHLAQLRNTLNPTTAGGMRDAAVNKLLEIVMGVCSGLEYIHSRHLVHRDICARNILLTASLDAKIAGFQFCSAPKDYKFHKGSVALSRLPLRWLAPEAFHGEFSAKSDVWSLGMMMYEVFSLGSIPLEHLSEDSDVIRAVDRGFRCQQPEFVPPDLWHRALKCWHRLPTHRPPVAKLRALVQQTRGNAAFDSVDGREEPGASTTLHPI